jgi:cupin 2 domain-containing protein
MLGVRCQNRITEMDSLFKDIPAELPEELIETICSTDCVKIERIVSRRHASPEGFWYDQDRNEFVLIVQGSAGLKFDGEDDIVVLKTGDYLNIVVLKTGDYLNIASHVKHRVEWTDSSSETIWLAVHY